MVEYKNPNCPRCGRFMDKVKAQVTEQLAGEATPVGSIVIAWVCTNPDCQEERG